MKYEQLKKHFKNPESMDRSAPFWSWNERMDPKEVKAQAHDMVEKGMGGYFMHSRVGLETEYLGKEWMDSVKACVDQAVADDACAWLYDEDRWPSGAAGGLVTKDHKEFGVKGIHGVFSDERTIEDEVLWTYEVQIKDDQLIDAQLLTDEKNKKESGAYLHVCLKYDKPSSWYNDAPPADNINKDCVKKFLEITMDRYKEEVGDQFGKAIPGVFTDEPNVSHIDGCYPYTYDYPNFFKERRGYGFEEIIPYLFMDGDQTKKAKHDYFHTYYEMFATNFSKQFYDWCKENNLLFTGHYLAENKMGDYIILSGGILLNYLYQDVPGIDMLGEFTKEYMTIKGCSSVANQTGRTRMLTETYGVSGWEFDFEGQKWIGDYQYVQGINLRCQHLAWYSMKGMRKRDYPPQFNYQTSWWKYNNVVEDYFARIGAITSKGYPVRNTLMIHPLSTAWIHLMVENRDTMDELGYRLNDYTKNLMSNHIEFDYGDEDILAQLGSVKNGRFIVGKAQYEKVIIPPFVETLYESTAKLLLEFMDAGGKVVSQSNKIRYIEAKENPLTEQLISHKNFVTTCSMDETVEHLDVLVSIKNEAMIEEKEVFYMLREFDDSYALFVINNDRDRGKNTTICMNIKGLVEEWDLLTEEVMDVGCSINDENMEFDCKLSACDSKMFIIQKNQPPKQKEHKSEKAYGFIAGLDVETTFKRGDKNVLVLDMCQMKLEDQQWTPKAEVWQNQKIIRKQLDMVGVENNHGVQRYLWADKPHQNDGKKVTIQFEFQVQDVPQKLQLVAEEIEKFNITLNNEKVQNHKKGWFIDKCMGIVDLPKAKQGTNTLTMVIKYMNATELENVFMIGDFALSTQRVIMDEPDTLRLGDWGLQGYFHYHSAIQYQYQFEYQKQMGKDLILRFEDYSAVVAFVRINGVEICVPWKGKGDVQIGGFVKEGINDIEVELMGSPRNMFGPLHLANTYEKWNDCNALHAPKHRYSKPYTTYPWGLMEQLCIYGR